MKLKNFMFHFTQFQPESNRRRRLHQNSERRERCRRQEDVCYLESEFFAETLLLLLSTLKSSRRSYICFQKFFFSSLTFLSAASFHKTALLSHSAAPPSFWPLRVQPLPFVLFSVDRQGLLDLHFFFANSELA